jgi:uncharacterized protein (DUF2235 family)
MVSFAYKSFMNGDTPRIDTPRMDMFKSTFCRRGVQVEFLGLFDTVASVARFDAPGRTPITLPTVFPAARHIRHAVALDERRIKFKPALFDQERQKAQEAAEQKDLDKKKRDQAYEQYKEKMEQAMAMGSEELKKAAEKEYQETLKKLGGECTLSEVWFVGNHG